MRITFDQIQSLGVGVLALTAVAVVVTITSGWLLARSARLEASFGALSGGAVAICGASAALSTIAMIVYPLVTAAIGFDSRAAGVFLGATIVKLFRVALLLPAVLVLAGLLLMGRN